MVTSTVSLGPDQHLQLVHADQRALRAEAQGLELVGDGPDRVRPGSRRRGIARAVARRGLEAATGLAVVLAVRAALPSPDHPAAYALAFVVLLLVAALPSRPHGSSFSRPPR